jgi:hypothetical protein
VDGVPHKIETFEPAIRRSFIPHLMPDPLLGVEARLIRGQESEMKAGMRLYEEINLFPFMPSGPVYVQPDRIASQCTTQMLQARKKSFPVFGGHRIIPVGNRGATHPNRLSRSRCWLVVGTLSRLPRLAHPIPRRGCRVNPVSSSKTIVSFGPSS